MSADRGVGGGSAAERQLRRRDRRFRRGAVVVGAAVGLLLFPGGSEAVEYWDADGNPLGNVVGTGAGLGGTGTWGSGSNWFNGTAEGAWVAGGDAVFNGAAGVVTLDSPQAAASVSFKSNGYRVSGSTLTMGPIGGPSANYNVDAGVTATIGSTIAGSATMVKSGPGTLVLANPANINTANTTAGGWRIDGGVLRVAGDGSLGAPLPDTARNTVTDIQLNQSTIQFDAPTTISINRRTKVGTNSSTNLGDAIIDVNEHTVSWFGSIQGGPGTLRVTSRNGNGGMLILGTDKIGSINPFGSVLPAGTVNLTVEERVVVQTSGQVTPTGGELGSETGAGGAPLAILLQSGGQIRSESGGYEFQRNLILGPGGGSLDVGAWMQTFLGTVSGSGSLSKFGSGPLVLDNPSATWSGGTRIHGGTLQLGRGGSNGLLPGTPANPSSVVIDSGATLRFNRGSNKSFFDIISGAGGVRITNSNNARVRLVSDNTYTGLTTISSGVLMIGQGNPGEPGSIVSNVLNNATLDFNRVENITYAGAISGSGVVIKEAAGKLTLSGANTYSGGTNIMAGTLIAANNTGSATGTGAVSVANGAGMGGGGSIAGAVTINSGAHLAPGASIGTLTVGRLTLSANSILDYEMATPALSDLTVISSAGGLVLNGGVVNVTSGAGFGVGEYPLFDYTTSFVGSVGNLKIGSAPSGFVYSLVNNAATTSIDLVVAVPEAGGLVGLGIILLVNGLRRGKRR